MAINAINFVPKSSNEFICEICDYKTSRLSQYNRHKLTAKHNMLCKMLYTEPNSNQIVPTHKCCNCEKYFKHQPSLSRHKKKCIKKENPTDLTIVKYKDKPVIDHEIVFNFVKQMTENNELLIKHQIAKEIENTKQSQEFQQQMFQQMIEFMKLQCNTTNNINNGEINNNTHNHFNLNLYLNETCKNAMNVDEFIDYLQPTLQELEDTARLGYIEGITRIILRGLKDLEENERPFHCSDLKRETMFVKNNNDIWEKEPDEKPQLMKVVKAIGRKNFCNVGAWQKAHPTWKNHDSKQNDQYNKILINSTSGSTEEEQKNSYEKIIKNIIKETVINKNKNRTI